MIDFIVSFNPKSHATHFVMEYPVQATDKEEAKEIAYTQFNNECDVSAYRSNAKVKPDRSMQEVA